MSSTAVDEAGEHITNNYGICQPECPEPDWWDVGKHFVSTCCSVAQCSVALQARVASEDSGGRHAGEAGQASSTGPPHGL